MSINIDPKKIRIWSKNPRYTNFSDINFQEIGKDDFEFSPFDEVKDVYYDGLEKNYLELINNYEKIKSMIALLESLSEGFNANIDEIIVTSSPFLSKNKIFDKNAKIFYYSLEGNRRILALNILLNTKNTLSDGRILEPRKIIYKFVSDKYPKFLDRLSNIFETFDKSKVNLDEIEVKFLSVESNTDDDIWKTLNARHFGKRKGKMNWPRGLVLSAINSKIEKIRNDLKLTIDEKISDDNYEKVIKNLENFTGKEISQRDLQMSLWTTYCSKIYNAQNDIKEFEKITYVNTEEEGNEINDDISENTDNQERFIFKISSLELAMSTIRIISSQGIYETLSKVIGLNIDIKKWVVNTNSNISKNVLDNLIIYIINLIKNKKLNTRHFDQDYENEIKKIISLKDDDKEEMENLIKKDINKISAKFAPLSLLIKSGYEEKLDFSKYTEKQKNDYLMKTKSIIENIIPILNRMIILENNWKDEIENLNNPYQYALVTIWITELNSILKNREITSIWNFPLLVFSSALRSTSELLMLMLIKQNINNHIFNNKLAEKQNLSLKDQQLLDVIERSSNRIEGWITSTESLTSFTNPFIKDIYKLFFINKKNDSTGPTFIAKNELKKILANVNELKSKQKDSNSLGSLSDKLESFINWSIKLSKNNGVSDVLNALIHTPSLLKDIHNNASDFVRLSNEFDKRINVIINFIEFILE